MISHRFLFLLLLLLPIHNSVAQEETFEPLFENIDITKGLPHNTVQKIFQDSEGYMWFATKDGLCRYDGYNFIVYCESLVKESISNSKVRCSPIPPVCCHGTHDCRVRGTSRSSVPGESR